MKSRFVSSPHLTPKSSAADIDSQGSYLIDRTSDLPKVVDIHANTVTKVDVNIDTGLR